MNPNKARQLAAELPRRRRITEPVYKFTSAERKRLEGTPVDEFFRPEFLETTLGTGWFRMTYYLSGPNISHFVKSLWPDVKTVGKLVKKLRDGGIYDLVGESGFGGSALTLLIDSLCAFGYDIPYNPPEPSQSSKVETVEMRRAKALAKHLGIPE